MNIKINISSKRIKKSHGFGIGGPVQKWVDNECIKLMDPYVPFRTGFLKGSATRHTVIGSGEIHYVAPYAKYMYYGKLMVDKITKSAYSPKYGSKELTDVDMKYNGAPTRGAFWDKRMKAAHMKQLVDGAIAIARKVSR